MALVGVTRDRLDLPALTAAIANEATGDGAVTAFTGLVRDHNQGRKVRFLEYEAYEPLAVRALELIVAEAR
jgi:molybdopterin synthase catalytic subunit